MSNRFSSAPLGSQERSRDLMAAAQRMLSGGSSPAPASSGSGTPFGASGRGEYLDNPAYAAEQMELINSGAPMSVGSDFRTYVEPRLNAQQASGLAKTFGLAGMNLDNQLVGLTNSQARKKAQELGEQRKGQVSANTSFAFNPQTLAGFKKSLDDIQLKLNDINNDPFKAKEQKQDEQKATVNSYTDQLAGLFNNLEELNTALQTPAFQKQVQTFEQQGGDMGQVAEKVQAPQSQFNMSIDEYLGNVETTAQKQAYESLFPEGKIAQDQIMMEQGIPEQYRQQYFGDSGIYQQQAKQAEERIKLIEKRQASEAKTARAQADFQVQKLQAQTELSKAKVEENRITAKNYITGQLAKLGALKTTGQAPIAVANLDQKYQAQVTELDTNFSLAKNEMEIKLNDFLRNLELDRDDEILRTREDLTLDQSKMMETIMKAQIDADRKSFKIISDFATDYRKESDKYQKELDKEAKKYTSEYTSIVSAYDITGMNFDMFKNNMNNMPSIRQMTEDPVTRMSMDRLRQMMPKQQKESNPQEFISRLISSGQLSPNTEDVLRGTKSLDTMVTSTRRKVEADMKKFGITKDMLGGTSTSGTSSSGSSMSDEEFIRLLNE